MVQTNTVQGPGGEAGVMRIKATGTPGHERGLAMALDGNGRWCYLDPKLGAMHAVAEAAAKSPAPARHRSPPPTASTSATPKNQKSWPSSQPPSMASPRPAPPSARQSPAATFLSITRPKASASIPRQSSASSAFSMTSTKAVPAGFQREGDAIILLWPVPEDVAPDPNLAVPFEPIGINPYIVPYFVYPLVPVDAITPVHEGAVLKRDAENRECRSPRRLRLLRVRQGQSRRPMGLGPPSLDLDAEADLAHPARRSRPPEAPILRARSFRRWPGR